MRDAYSGLYAVLGVDRLKNVTVVGPTEDVALRMAAVRARSLPGAQLWASALLTLPKVRLLAGGVVPPLSMAAGSMDAILLSVRAATEVERSLLALWPFVKPGGCLCFEDVATFVNQTGVWERADTGYSEIAHSGSWMKPEAKRIFAKHDSLLADTARAIFLPSEGNHSNYHSGMKRNTHALILRKRTEPRTVPVKVTSAHVPSAQHLALGIAYPRDGIGMRLPDALSPDLDIAIAMPCHRSSLATLPCVTIKWRCTCHELWLLE